MVSAENAGHLRLDGIGGQWGGFTLRPVELDIAPGEYLVLLGPSGCGKTTLMDLVCGLRRPVYGRIWCDGRDITRADPAERGIGYVPQDYELFPTRNVRQNLEFGPHIRRERGAAVAERLEHIVGMLHLEPLLERRVGTLSGGECQRVALGRALMASPKILILDEPVSALPPALRDTVCQELKALQTRLGITTIHVSHNLDEALAVADRMAIMEVGWVAQAGTPEEVLHRPVDRFVAEFTRCRNLWPVRVRAGEVLLDGRVVGNSSRPEGEYWLALRPEDLRVAAATETPALNGVVGQVVRGTHTRMVRVDFGEHTAWVCDHRACSPGESVGICLPSQELWLLPR